MKVERCILPPQNTEPDTFSHIVETAELFSTSKRRVQLFGLNSDIIIDDFLCHVHVFASSRTSSIFLDTVGVKGCGGGPIGKDAENTNLLVQNMENFEEVTFVGDCVFNGTVVKSWITG
jgi:hypothetical protein